MESTRPLSRASRTSSSASAESRGARAWLLYDADCGVCKFIVARVLDWDRAGFLHPLALQDPRAADLLPHLTPDERMRSFHLVEPGGEVFSAEAGLARLADYLPGFPRLAASGYWRVAGNRDRLGRLVPGFLCRQAERRIASRRA